MKKAKPLLFYIALFFIGAGAGLGVNVSVSRGAPVIRGGGEVILLLTIPAAVYAGYRIGSRNKKNEIFNEYGGSINELQYQNNKSEA